VASDQISRAGKKWLTVNSIPELATLFGRPEEPAADGPREAFSVIESLPDDEPTAEPAPQPELPPLPGDADESRLFVRPVRTRAIAVGVAAVVAAIGLAVVWWKPWSPTPRPEPPVAEAPVAREEAPTPAPTPAPAPEPAPAPAPTPMAAPTPAATPEPAPVAAPAPAAAPEPAPVAAPAPAPLAAPTIVAPPAPTKAPEAPVAAPVAAKPATTPKAPAAAPATASTVSGWIALGDRLLARDPQKALDAYLHAYSQDPYRADVLSRLGDVFQRLGNLPKAIQHYQRALQAGAGFGPAYVGLAEALRQSGNVDEARRTLQIYLERFPSGSLRARVEEMLSTM